MSDSQHGLPLLDFLEVTPTCPVKPILLSAANKYRRAVQFASELGELPITAIKLGAGLAVGDVVVIDQGCQLRNLILKCRLIGPAGGRRPLSRRTKGAPLLPAQLGNNFWVISIDRVAGYPCQSTEF